MSKQQRQNAPDAPKAPGAAEKPSEPTNVDAPAGAAPDAPKAPGDGAAEGSSNDPDKHEHEIECPACIALNGERPCSVECYVAAGYTAEGYAERFGASPESVVASIIEDAPPKFVAPEGKAHCLALATCGVRGMPAFAGAEFWLELHEAAYLESLGHVEILNK